MKKKTNKKKEKIKKTIKCKNEKETWKSKKKKTSKTGGKQKADVPVKKGK